MGSAQLFLDELKRRRKEMPIVFSKDEVAFLNALVREPNRLPMQLAGMTTLYKAKDFEGAAALHSLKIWLETRVLQKRGNGEGFEFRAWTGTLKPSFCTRLLSIVEFYEPLGLTAFGEWPTLYWNIRRKLEGKPEIQYEDPEEVASKDAT